MNAQSFLMVNSHLTFPHCQMYKDMRLDQIKVVLESVRDYVTRESLHDVPIVRLLRLVFAHVQLILLVTNGYSLSFSSYAY